MAADEKLHSPDRKENTGKQHPRITGQDIFHIVYIHGDLSGYGEVSPVSTLSRTPRFYRRHERSFLRSTPWTSVGYPKASTAR